MFLVIKKVKNILGIGFIGILFCCSCNKAVSVDDFFKKVSEDKDYRREAEIGEFKLVSQYRPSELICLAEMAKGKEAFRFDKNVFDEELKKYSNSYYVELTIGLTSKENIMLRGLRDQADYAARLGELTYLLNKDFYILQDNDTTKALSCIFSNTYGNSPNIKAMFIFPKKQLTDNTDIKMIYDDKAFGIPEKAVFSYNLTELNKGLPRIIEQKK